MLAIKLLLALAIYLGTFSCMAEASYPGSAAHGQIIEIVLPHEVEVQEFSYRPTPEGYKYSYTLSDGIRHEEIANIVDPNSPEAASYIKSEMERRNRPRPKAGTKNRKLSPKSLQSLAG